MLLNKRLYAEQADVFSVSQMMLGAKMAGRFECALQTLESLSFEEGLFIYFD